MQAGEQPGFGELKLALNGGAADTQSFGGFIGSASQKEAQFHHARLSFIEQSEVGQGAVQSDHFLSGRVDPYHFLMQGNSHIVTPRRALPRVVDKNAPHHKSCESVEMAPAGELNRALAGEADVELIYQAGSLNRVRSVSPSKQSGGDGVQIPVGGRRYFRQRARIAFAPALQETGDIADGWLFVAHRTSEFTSFWVGRTAEILAIVMNPGRNREALKMGKLVSVIVYVETRKIGIVFCRRNLHLHDLSRVCFLFSDRFPRDRGRGRPF